MLSSCVPALPVEDAGATLEAADLAPLLSDPDVGGLAEMMNVPGLLGGAPNVLEKVAAAQAAGKVIDGHAPMLSGAGLDVFKHEPYVPQDPARDLRTLTNVVMTPHLAGNTRESCRRVAERVMKNLRLAVSGNQADMDLVE
jgi:hypothetical protein